MKHRTGFRLLRHFLCLALIGASIFVVLKPSLSHTKPAVVQATVSRYVLVTQAGFPKEFTENDGKENNPLAAAQSSSINQLMLGGNFSLRSAVIVIGKTAIASLIMWLLVTIINKNFQLALDWFTSNVRQRIPTIEIGSQKVVQADQIEKAVIWLVNLFRAFLFFALGSIFLRLVLSFLPQTKNFSQKLFEPIATSIVRILQGFISYLPSLIFLIILFVITYYILQLVRLVFGEIDKGALSIVGFDQEWAKPTARIIQIMAVTFALVVSFPYLPGYSTEAFQGFSIFFGVLISFGSSSAIKNIIAGIVLTYTRAFKIGDDVEIGSVGGTVVEKGLLVTQLLTFTNIIVSIPNSEVFSGHITNFRKGSMKVNASYHTPPPIIKMEFSFAFDVPWQEIHAVLLEAANSCEWVLADPLAFVLHQELFNNCHCIYALRVFTNYPEKGAKIKSWIMQQVQDICISKGNPPWKCKCVFLSPFRMSL